MQRTGPITNIKMVVKDKYISHLSTRLTFPSTEPSLNWCTSCCHLVGDAPFLHEKLQKTPWPDESNGGVSPLMSSWWIFSVLLLQWFQRVFVFRKRRQSSPGIAAVLLHRRNWFLNVTVESAVPYETKWALSPLSFVVRLKIRERNSYKIHKQSYFNNES